jgi:hypothetical protein
VVEDAMQKEEEGLKRRRESQILSSHRNEGTKFRVNQSEEWNLFANQALRFVLSDIPWKFLFWFI